MARKSRKQSGEPKTEGLLPEIIEPKSERIPTALYARLSVEKENDDSIETQVSLIKNHIAHTDDLVLADVYIDNGFSGTAFERPDFLRLMEDVKKGKIQCIVVKDLSRFGRNFLETGYYIETFLPKLNVRLIAINDNFDSSREEDRNNISVPLKNLVNEFYARDISKRVSTYHELSMSRGSAIIPRATYGYRLDKTENRLYVNPETAPVVKMIFRWYLMGMTTGKIAARLNNMGVLTPKAYRMVKERGEAMPENELWNIGKLRDILRNQVYLGRLVWGKRKRAFYLKIAEHKTSKDEWIIHENQHEALVTESEYERVQELISRSADKMRTKPELYGEHEEPLRGKVFCAVCGRVMTYESYAYCNNRNGGHFYCHGNNLRSECRNDMHSDLLKMTVASQMQVFIKAVVDRKALLSEMKTDRSRQNRVMAAENNLQKIRTRLSDTSEKISILYENYVEGLLGMDEYQEMKSHYMEEMEVLKKMLGEAEEESESAHILQSQFLELGNRLEGYLNEPGFISNLAEDLVERINISPDGSVDIVYSCEDVFQAVG
jgi:site-specific DNA recombinase